jgi:urea transport system permease protein
VQDRFAWLAALVFVLLSTALPARADEFAALLPALGGGSFAEKEQAVVALGKLGDERAVVVLMALKDGRLIKAPDGRLLVFDATKLTDPITGADGSAVAADAAERIRVNNRLRGVIEGALGELTLFSSDPAARLAAAQDALRHPSADQAALLEKALSA